MQATMNTDLLWTQTSVFSISLTALELGFVGCGRALRIKPPRLDSLGAWLIDLRKTEIADLPLNEWRQRAWKQFEYDSDVIDFFDLVLGIAYLQDNLKSESGNERSSVAMNAWVLIRKVLGSEICQAITSRSAQGFLYLPLFSTVKNDGETEQWWRLHLWLPDQNRGDPAFRIHAHSTHGQSWILAGKGLDQTFIVSSVEEDPISATHAMYELQHKYETKSGRRLRTATSVQNTGNLVKAEMRKTQLHTRGMVYEVPAGSFHTSEIGPNDLHVTIFVFDSHRGIAPSAGILGPKDRKESTSSKLQGTEGLNSKALRCIVDDICEYEDWIRRAHEHAHNSEVEMAEACYHEADKLSAKSPVLSKARLHGRKVSQDGLDEVEES